MTILAFQHAGANPHKWVWLSAEIRNSLDHIERVDRDGWLYCVDYRGNYYSPLLQILPNVQKMIKEPGCSVFENCDERGDMLTCRNYDLLHSLPSGEATGLNVIVRCHPKGKYKSIGVADAEWISYINEDYRDGVLDDGETDISPLCFLPYLCMDGMNEKGLTVSILALELKDGETPVCQEERGKKKTIHTMLMRYMLDSCATVAEAVALAEKYNMINTAGHDYHVFVTDKDGNSAIFEWRYNKLKVTEVNAATNFYLGYEDKFGQGQDRYNTIVEKLNSTDVMDQGECFELLDEVHQEPDTTGGYTQYSVIYNADQLTMTVRCRECEKKLEL